MRPWMFVLAGSFGAGALMVAAAPSEWRIGWEMTMALGGALYYGALRRYVARMAEERQGRGTIGVVVSMAPGLAWRAGIFFALVATQAVLCYAVSPEVDLRLPFVALFAWVVAEASIDRPSRRPA